MNHPFEIYQDDTMACLLADYVNWARRQGSMNYKMPEELRQGIEQEINRISDLMRKEQE